MDCIQRKIDLKNVSLKNGSWFWRREPFDYQQKVDCCRWGTIRPERPLTDACALSEVNRLGVDFGYLSDRPPEQNDLLNDPRHSRSLAVPFEQGCGANFGLVREPRCAFKRFTVFRWSKACTLFRSGRQYSNCAGAFIELNPAFLVKTPH